MISGFLVGALSLSLAAQPLDIAKYCSEPEKAFEACTRLPEIYQAAVFWETQSKYLTIDNQKLALQLEEAERKLLEKDSTPEPEGITLPSWLTIALPIGAAVVAAGATFILVK